MLQECAVTLDRLAKPLLISSAKRCQFIRIKARRRRPTPNIVRLARENAEGSFAACAYGCMQRLGNRIQPVARLGERRCIVWTTRDRLRRVERPCKFGEHG